MPKTDLMDNETYIQDFTGIGAVRVLARENGDPAMLAVAVAGKRACEAFMAIVPTDDFSECRGRDGKVLGLAGFVCGSETCLKVSDLMDRIDRGEG